ncbi:hypothetical protein N3K66_004174 [Trichothecium roseum]|uniref:Uncharacterized protein n=1 Tax=Trichothecium roseum TaxID=47278 RepID=A0ACC0V0V2_9HYPO|nr:hypothetical protein N3K66_004174 [Trichothecium roseum]
MELARDDGNIQLLTSLPASVNVGYKFAAPIIVSIPDGGEIFRAAGGDEANVELEMQIESLTKVDGEWRPLNYPISEALGVPARSDPVLYRRGYFYWVHMPRSPLLPVEVAEGMRGRIMRVKTNVFVTVSSSSSSSSSDDDDDDDDDEEKPKEKKRLRWVHRSGPMLVFQHQTDIEPDRRVEKDDDSSEYSDDEGDDGKDASKGDNATEVERDLVKRARSASISGDDEAEKVSLAKRMRRASIGDDDDGDGDDDDQ